MEQRISNAIDVFLDAINNGTLAKGSCAACAVGNLICKAKNIELTTKLLKSFNTNTGYKSYADFSKKTNFPNKWYFNSVMGCLVDSFDTEFTGQELGLIEIAFEDNTYILGSRYYLYSKKEIRADQIKGLEAVVKVMLTFNNDTETDVKEVFTNKAKLIVI